MTSHDVTSLYESPLRAAQKEATRALILKAALDVLSGGAAEFSFAAIAKAARVTERTVYRHFPNREALFAGMWGALDSRIGLGAFPSTEEAVRASPLNTFPAFDEHEGLMRAFWTTEEGRAFRLSVNEARQRAIRASVRDAVKGLPQSEAAAVTAAVQLLYSGAAWMTMKDYWGFDGTTAGKASAFAIGLILDGARARAAKTGKAGSKTKKGNAP